MDGTELQMHDLSPSRSYINCQLGPLSSFMNVPPEIDWAFVVVLHLLLGREVGMTSRLNVKESPVSVLCWPGHKYSVMR